MSIKIVITRGDLPLLEGRFTKAATEVHPLMQKAMNQIGEETMAALKDATPVGTGRTGGHLDNSYKSEPTDTGVRVGTDQGQKLNWVRFGTTTPITPVFAKALYSPELPHPMAWVHGQHANDFVAPVLDDIEQYIENAINPFIQQLEQTLQGG